MTRLIDADRLRNIAISNRDVEMVYEIDHSPTVERPHGEWKPDGTCSECGVYSSLNKNTAYFCPNCGQRKKKEGDEK